VIISVNSMDWSVFLMEMQCVFCLVGTELLNIMQMNMKLKMVNYEGNSKSKVSYV
jgi:hypothetical protein